MHTCVSVCKMNRLIISKRNATPTFRLLNFSMFTVIYVCFCLLLEHTLVYIHTLDFAYFEQSF